jgi:uncharacterized protein
MESRYQFEDDRVTINKLSIIQNPPESATTEAFEFVSHGTICRGRVFLPTSVNEHHDQLKKVVLLAHGFGCLQTFEPINSLVRALIKTGIGCATFDYRGFGESDTPRHMPSQLIHPDRLLEDWREALKSLTVRMGRNCSIGLWGTSFSGGHVIVTAANHSSSSPRGVLGFEENDMDLLL